MSHQSTVVFAPPSGSSVTVNGPAQPQEVNVGPPFVTERSANGTLWTYQMTSTHVRIWTLHLDDLSQTQKSELEGFFLTVVKGPSTLFTYTHTDGASYTVRFTDTQLRFTRRGPQQWQVTVNLEVFGEIA